MSSRFVIFSQARSGSTMLALSLNSHQHVVCHDEVLSISGVARLVPKERNLKRYSWKHIRKWRTERDVDPIKFLEEHVWPIEAKHVGFKMVLEDIFLSPHKETYLDYFSNEEILPVILYREDQLAVYASCELLAQNRVRYSLVADEETELDAQPFFVVPKQLERFRSGQLTKLNNLKDRFPSAYIMRYERMREEYSGLIDYLGIGGPQLEELTRKTAPNDLAEIIANYAVFENLPRTIEL